MPTWLFWVLVPVGLVILAVPGLWLFMSLTATPLHPDPQKVPAVTRAKPTREMAALVERARELALAHLVQENLPGISVAVGRRGELVWAEGLGYADLKGNAPVTPEHRFRIGTASTALTSAAAGLLIESGQLKPDDEIQAYVPAFPKKQWPVTVRQLMSHTAGVSSDAGDEGPLFNKHCEQPADAIKYFANDPLRFQPGTQYRYSRYGWILMSAAIEAAADQSYATYLRERVFHPLGMRDTMPDGATVEGDDDHPLFNMARELIVDPRTKRDPKASGAGKGIAEPATYYFPRFAADPKYGLHLMRPLDYSCYAGASAFVSTPSDLVRFGMAMNSGKLLQPATVELLQKSQRGTATLAGKQVRMIRYEGDSLGGNVATLMTLPEQGLVVAVTSNISYANTVELGRKIAEVFVAGQGR